MPFYEIVFETGRNSVAEYADDDEALGAARAHAERAMAGGPCLLMEPNSPPAERIVKLYKYEKHPNDYNPDQAMSADVLKSEVTDLIKALSDENGVVAIDRLAVEVRGLSHPMIVGAGPHDTIYKMEADEELSLGTFADGKWTD